MSTERALAKPFSVLTVGDVWPRSMRLKALREMPLASDSSRCDSLRCSRSIRICLPTSMPPSSSNSFDTLTLAAFYPKRCQVTGGRAFTQPAACSRHRSEQDIRPFQYSTSEKMCSWSAPANYAVRSELVAHMIMGAGEGILSRKPSDVQSSRCRKLRLPEGGRGRPLARPHEAPPGPSPLTCELTRVRLGVTAPARP